MTRGQISTIATDLDKKMVFLTGPRQVGKTTMARSLIDRWPTLQYLNYDALTDRPIILQQSWSREAPLVILDEVHKLKLWKSRLKGVYDTEGIPPRVLVTGSARLDVYRRAGDSLAGRYFRHRLYPFSVRELRGQSAPHELLDQLLRFGGFPEPFFGQSERTAARWRQTHLERIIREDVQDLEPVRDLHTMLTLIDLLRSRVGSPISYANLANDLAISPHTVKRWIQTLEHMYVLFIVTPYHRNIGRAILKEPKIYFFDTGAVHGDVGAKLENTVAVSLLKHLHYLEDTEGKTAQLHYVRDKAKREVDFVTVIDRQVQSLIEVKTSDTAVSPALRFFRDRLAPQETRQIVQHCPRSQTHEGIHVSPAATWLDGLAL